MNLNDLIILFYVIPLLKIGDILFGIALAEFDHKFDKEIMWLGIKKALLVYAGIIIGVFVSLQASELISLEFNGEVYTLFNAIYLTLLVVVGVYAKDFMIKLSKVFQVDVKEEN